MECGREGSLNDSERNGINVLMLWISPLGGLDLPPDPTELQIEVVAEAGQQMASFECADRGSGPPPEFHALKQQSYVALRTLAGSGFGAVELTEPWSCPSSFRLQKKISSVCRIL